MKKITLLWLFLLSSIYVRADIIVTESVESGGQSMSMTLKFKGDKIRMDASPQMSLITDTATGDTLTLMHSEKSYMVISGEKTKAMAEQLKKFQPTPAPGDSPAPKPKLVDTGKSEKVGSFNAEIYTLNDPSKNLTMWITKEIPNYAVLQEKLKKMRNMHGLGPASNLSPEESDLQGVPVKTQIVSKGKTMTVTITSVEEKPIDDAEMAAPAGYTKISMPSFGGSLPPAGPVPPPPPQH